MFNGVLFVLHMIDYIYQKMFIKRKTTALFVRVLVRDTLFLSRFVQETGIILINTYLVRTVTFDLRQVDI